MAPAPKKPAPKPAPKTEAPAPAPKVAAPVAPKAPAPVPAPKAEAEKAPAPVVKTTAIAVKPEAKPAVPAGAPGVDVASFQGTPGQWAKAAGNITWAAVKFTELQPGRNGQVRYLNPDAFADWAALKAAGRGRIAYMFGHPNVPSGPSVAWFLDRVLAAGLEDGDGVALDLEVTGGRSPADVSAWGRQVLDALEHRTGRAPLIYTFLSFAQAGNCAGMGAYPLWMADPSSPAGRPRVPTVWKTWAIHQYAVTGGIDRDVACEPTWDAMADRVGKPKKPAPKPAPGGTVKDLGGKLPTANGRGLGTCRWADGTTVVAGVGAQQQVTATRWTPDDKEWGEWARVTAGPAVGAPVLEAWGKGDGRLYFTTTTGHVLQLTTDDYGATWK